MGLVGGARPVPKASLAAPIRITVDTRHRSERMSFSNGRQSARIPYND